MATFLILKLWIPVQHFNPVVAEGQGENFLVGIDHLVLLILILPN